MKRIFSFVFAFVIICCLATVVSFADSADALPVEPENTETNEASPSSLTTEPPVSSGVYRFDSLYNIDMCMMVEEDGHFNGALVLQWNTSDNVRETLFKVEYVGYGTIPATNTTEYYYVIRSMVNSGMGLTAHVDDTVCLRGLLPDNSKQSWSQYWVYTEDSGCDIWMNASTGDYLGVPTIISSGAELEMTSGTTQSWWQMVAYTGPVLEGIEFAETHDIVYGGESVYFFAYMYSSRVGVNGPVQYHLMETDNYHNSFDAEVNATLGIVTGLKEATVVIHATVSGMTVEATHTFNVVGYATADLAAAGFSEEFYDVAMYLRFHLTGLIYKDTIGVVTTYYHTAPAPGTPHTYESGLQAPAGTTKVGIVFIEVTSNTAEEDDYTNFDEYDSGVSLYICLGGTVLKKYDDANSAPVDIAISARWWRNEEREVWKELYEDEWNNHCSYCITCDPDDWPR